MNLYQGDCLEILRFYPDEYFDAVITDAPYEWGILNSKWDSTGVTFREDTWAEMFRVLKPGAFLVSFCGDRTYHRMACSIEDAGFKIENMLIWTYAQGMPKNNSKIKPAIEPICLAKKPGNGELNIKACRFPVRGKEKPKFPVGSYSIDSTVGAIRAKERFEDSDPTTRYPANLIISDDELLGDKAPYFFCAKPTPSERGRVTHATLKPLRLMRWLVRLVARPGQVILDPFMGSGTTLIAALESGCDGVGIDLKKTHFLEAKDRIQAWFDKPTVDLTDPLEKLKQEFDKLYG